MYALKHVFLRLNFKTMSNILSKLEPSLIWQYFEEICSIPRPSKREDKIRTYLKNWGESHKLETKVDKVGNVLICKPATPGMENRKIIILQSHMDMVCENNSDIEFDWDNDPVIPRIDGEWVYATGTTLGADNGIGIAAQLAILADNNIKHGPIECLFTTDEETGLTGAFGLEPGFLKGTTLLNLDSEGEGELYIGCAGGKDSVIELPLEWKQTPPSFVGLKIEISGLKGGHSGDDINKGLGNANKILNRILWYSAKKFNFNLSDFSGGNLRNAIAREAYAIIGIEPAYKNDFNAYAKTIFNDIYEELRYTDPGLIIVFKDEKLPEKLVTKASSDRLFSSLYACPHGVIAMSPVITGLVETSTNLASVRTKENHFLITTSQRSSIESAKHDIANMVASVFSLTGAKVTHGDGYPGWSPNPKSEILEITKAAYIRLFKEEPKVLAIHAGLECGLIGEKYPEMDMVSYGPTILGAHSPDERLMIDTVKRFWDYTLEILKNAPIAG